MLSINGMPVHHVDATFSDESINVESVTCESESSPGHVPLIVDHCMFAVSVDVFESGGEFHYGAIKGAAPAPTSKPNAAIAEPSLSLASALEKFADASFSTRGKDFSDSIATQSAPPRTGESRAAKLHRLKAEIAALQLESTTGAGGDDDDDGADSASIADDVRALAATLQQLSAKQQARPVAAVGAAMPAAAVVAAATASESATVNVALERRVAALEAALGLDKNVATRADLADAVAHLEQRMRDVLEFDATAARVRLLISEIDALNAKSAAAAAAAGSSAAASTATDVGETIGEPLLAMRAQVIEAHALLQQVAPVASSLPAIAERLRALRTLHTAALDAAGCAARVEGAQNQVRAQLKENAELLAALQQSSAQSTAAAQANVAALQKRLDALAAKK
jgi:hypothetical protein